MKLKKICQNLYAGKNFNITYILKELAKLGICNLLVEGGREIYIFYKSRFSG